MNGTALFVPIFSRHGMGDNGGVVLFAKMADYMEQRQLLTYQKWGIQLFTVKLQLRNGIKERSRTTQTSQGGG